MPSSNIARQMNRSLETKLAIFENMAEHVDLRPVIFTSRAEIWSTDRNPVIVTGHPFPSVSPNNDNPNPGYLTREMMEYYRNLPTVKEREDRLLNLILFEFQVRGSTEVHAIFSRRKRSAEDIPERIYLKNLDPTEVLTRQHSAYSNEEKGSRTSLQLVLAADQSVARPAWFSGDIRLFSVTTTSDKDRDIGPVESRLGPEMCGNLDQKVKLFEFCATADVKGVTFTSVPYLWESEIPWFVITDRLPRVPVDYDHELYDIEQDIIDYVTHVARRRKYASFYAYSRRFGDGQFADVHLLFARNDELAPSLVPAPSVSSLSSDSGLRGPPVPPRRPATIRHRWPSSPAAKADIEELTSSAARQLSFESLSSDLSSVPSLPPQIKITTVEYRQFTNSEDESMVGSQSSDSAIRAPPIPPRISADHRRYSSPAGALVESPHSARSSPSVTSRNMVPGEYRRYSSPSSEGVSGLIIRHEVKVERNVRNMTSSFDALSTDSGGSSEWSLETELVSDYDENDERQPLAFRLGSILLRDLDKNLRVYAGRSKETQHSAYIFTDDHTMWKEDWDPVIVVTNLPRIPPYYDHERHDIVQDIVDYMRLSYLEMKKNEEEQFHVSTLRFETGTNMEVHILLSQHEETATRYYFDVELGPSLGLPSSRVHSLPEVHDLPAASPQTSAGSTDAGAGGASSTRHARSVPAEFVSDESLGNLSDIPEGCVFPRNPDEYVP